MTVPAGFTLVIISHSDHGSRFVTSYARNSSSTSVTIPEGSLYQRIDGHGIMEFGNENGKLFSLDDMNGTDSASAFIELYSNVVTFSR